MPNENNILIKENEIIEDLQRNGLKIIRSKDGFTYGTDSVLLAAFAKLRQGDKVCDLGAGNGILSFLIFARYPNLSVDALEIDLKKSEQMQRSILLNGLEDKIHVYNQDLRRIKDSFKLASYDAVICNPPYYIAGKDASKTQINADFFDVALAAKKLLRFRGKIITMCKMPRMFHLSNALQENNFAVSRVRLVKSKPNKTPYLVMMEAILGARSECRLEETLVLTDDNNQYTEELKEIYFS
ncbi:MAG: methyltransferase [Eubacteriales bacterium]|nr:methyltransferase [Eubacteriales bacterium]